MIIIINDVAVNIVDIIGIFMQLNSLIVNRITEFITNENQKHLVGVSAWYPPANFLITIKDI